MRRIVLADGRECAHMEPDSIVAAEGVSHERGQSHTFECNFPISAARYILNWHKNDESVMNYFSDDPAPTFTGDLADRAGVRLVNRRNLEIQNLRVSDEGEYYCSVYELGAGGQSGEGMRYQLVVYVPPTISVSGGPYEAEVGGKMMVTCRANSHPPSNFTWTSPLGNVLHGAVLEIASMTTADIGRYMCIANNGYEVASAYVDISIKEAPNWSGPGAVAGAAVGCFIGGLLVGGAAVYLFLPFRAAKNDGKIDIGDRQYENVPHPRMASQRPGSGNDEYEVPMETIQPLTVQPPRPSSHYQELKSAIYPSLQNTE
ncbi:hypothetical protein Bbelb_313460 [Branchiostoma belcheri]|nr:hypothetical protein Bbelb_313460 [Branchiostoma belcheri]